MQEKQNWEAQNWACTARYAGVVIDRKNKSIHASFGFLGTFFNHLWRNCAFAVPHAFAFAVASHEKPAYDRPGAHARLSDRHAPSAPVPARHGRDDSKLTEAEGDNHDTLARAPPRERGQCHPCQLSKPAGLTHLQLFVVVNKLLVCPLAWP